MKNNRKKLFVLLLTAFLLASALPTAALAAGKIVTDQPVDLTISFKDGAKAIPRAHFVLYKVADVNEFTDMTLTADFEAYRGVVSGLSELNDLSQEQWAALASTLKGYAVNDELPPTAEGETDSDGLLPVPGLEVGLYLVIGERATTSDYYVYYPVPFMLFLPADNSARNVWDYAVTSAPKFTRDYCPPDDDITRKALKKWEDDGYETIRPAEVTVQLLMDGRVYDTKTLNKDNNWRCSWSKLDPDHEWEVIEKPIEGYTVSIVRNGVTFVLTNKYVPSITQGDPPVQKRIIGDVPETDSTFTFVMKSLDPSFPMPEGSSDGVKEVSIVGAGIVEFGDFIFTRPGTYAYTVSERNTGDEGYTYDSTVFYVTYDVTEKDGKLNCVRTMEDQKGNAAEVAEFTNEYKAPEDKLPQTGLLWWPVPVLLCTGLALVTLGVVYRRRKEK